MTDNRPNAPQDSDYFGYSVASGVFDKDNANGVYYVAGAPRGALMLGQVINNC